MSGSRVRSQFGQALLPFSKLKTYYVLRFTLTYLHFEYRIPNKEHHTAEVIK
jgi:hypothetical protein